MKTPEQPRSAVPVTSRLGYQVAGSAASTTAQPMSAGYLYALYDTAQVGLLDDAALAGLTERHKYALSTPSLRPVTDLAAEVIHSDTAGIVIGLTRGHAPRKLLRIVAAVLKQGRPVYFHWPEEQAVERIDRYRFRSYLKLWFVVRSYNLLARGWALVRSLRRLPQGPTPFERLVMEMTDRLMKLSEHAAPVPFVGLDEPPTAARPMAGPGVYLRLDFWARINSGGSYGHTCHVARELARASQSFLCFNASHFALLDEMGVQQIVLPAPGVDGNEENLIAGTKHYHVALKAVLEILRPAYIYERLCLGNSAGAWLSQELGIPYIVEYNGSEISMKRSFDGTGYQHEAYYLASEMFSFHQATAISVISEPVKDELVARGIPPWKILVNPNGADPEVYAPPTPAQKTALRKEFGWDDSHRVIGFTGTFGGWHGIDILAEALPRICQRVPEARFLLIGDGSYKHLVDKAIIKHQLEGHVRSVGRVPQQEGARLLGACDLFVSPHNKHMVDSRFFGSPTKIFEYMAVAGGVVASDLEQIGQILSPALRASDWAAGAPTVTNQRAVLCKPGDVDEFVEAVVRLVQSPEVCEAIGRNARQAVLEHYSWEQHVAKLWRFCRSARPPVQAEPSADTTDLDRISTGDDYKDEVQNQWNSDPCGSHYVKKASAHTVDWFLEAERYRYGEYASWMPKMMEFSQHAGEEVLEIGGGMGTDLAQFARHGARTTDLDLSAGHLALARENFALRGLKGRFVHHDAERLPFDDGRFDLVYSNGVIHHTPNTAQVISEIHRVLKPGGRAIIMVYAENSLHYWARLVYALGLAREMLEFCSMGEIMSRHVELTTTGARPLVKVYTKGRLRDMFAEFADVQVCKRQLIRVELPPKLRWLPVRLLGRLMGWNLIVKATKSIGEKRGQDS